MAALYVEMAPGNEVFRVVDIAVKATEARPGAQIVEREFGMFEVHSPSQAAVLEAGNVVLARWACAPKTVYGRKWVSTQVITRIDPYQAQLLNRFRRGSMLVPAKPCWCWNARRRHTSTLPATRRRRRRISGSCTSPPWPVRTDVALGERSRNPHGQERRDSGLEGLKAGTDECREMSIHYSLLMKGTVMPKKFYTEKDVEDCFHSGVLSLESTTMSC